MTTVNSISPQWVQEVQNTAWGTLVTVDNNSIDTANFSWYYEMTPLINKSISAGTTYSGNAIVSTYSLVYTSGVYAGGVISPNGDIHFIPDGATVGQKISSVGIVSTIGDGAIY